MNSFETTILDGFPVTVEYEICSPDYQSPSEYAEVTQVTLRDGKPAKFVTTKLTIAQWTRLATQADDHIHGVTS